MKKIITKKQEEVLLNLAKSGTLHKPRNALERLQKKGMVKGNKQHGWTLTSSGLQWLERLAQAEASWQIKW